MKTSLKYIINNRRNKKENVTLPKELEREFQYSNYIKYVSKIKKFLISCIFAYLFQLVFYIIAPKLNIIDIETAKRYGLLCIYLTIISLLSYYLFYKEEKKCNKIKKTGNMDLIIAIINLVFYSFYANVKIGWTPINFIADILNFIMVMLLLLLSRRIKPLWVLIILFLGEICFLIFNPRIVEVLPVIALSNLIFIIVMVATSIYEITVSDFMLNINLENKNKIIEEEKNKSRELLLNILPEKVANELMETGKSEPKIFEDVSVIFSDFVGFTNISSRITPKKLIEELNDIYTKFDMIIKKHNCERIKTVGDAYMAVCGMPNINKNHAENIVRAGLEIIEFVENRNKNSDIEWKLRVGIHSGTVIAGIVGVDKFIYDIFGDTVNIASRMQSNSEPCRVNISSDTYKKIKDKFICKERNSTYVKGKGQMIMYFVEKPKLGARHLTF